MDRFEELGKIILQTVTPDEDLRFVRRFDSCPAFEGKMVFMSEEKEKEWQELDPEVKKSVMQNLHKTCEAMEMKNAIQLLCHVVNDLDDKIKRKNGIDDNDENTKSNNDN